jgi:hypothetical protein
MASMVFTSIVRTFLRAGIRAASELVIFSKRYVEQGVDVEPVHIHAYSMLESVTRQSPISLEFAAKFLEEIDAIMEKILSGTFPAQTETNGQNIQTSRTLRISCFWSQSYLDRYEGLYIPSRKG